MEEGNAPSKSHKLWVTALINMSFVFLGVQECVFGPTLLDMTDIYVTKIKVITIVVLLRAIGSVIGASIAGILLDKLQDYRYFLLFAYTFLMGIANGLLPHLGHLWLFFAISVLASFACGSLDTGGNVLCLDIWKNGDAGPYLHSIHFSFGLGAFIAPVIAIPFLGNDPDQENEEVMTKPTKITILYPLIGLAIILCALCYLLFGLRNYKQSTKRSDQESTREKGEMKSSSRLTSNQWILLILMWIFFFSYVGAEVCYGVYSATFVVKSKLQLTKQIGAEITAIFFGCFASMRFLSIFAAIYFRPIFIMLLSCLLSCIGGLALVLYGEESLLVLKIASAMLGFGMASIYATGMLWLEQHIKITNRIGASMVIAGSIGADVFPMITGQLIVDFPMIIMYLTFATIAVCTVIFIVAIVVGKQIVTKDEPQKAVEELESMNNK